MSILHPDVESRLEDQYWKTVGGDVVCPPDPTARCGHCELALEDHNTLGPDDLVTPENAICLDDTALLWRTIIWNRFTLAPGQNFDCRAVMRCEVCDVLLCSEHSTNFTTCAESEYRLHHLACRDHCDPCSRGIAEDASFQQWRDAS
jgi:hypothetical protein